MLFGWNLTVENTTFSSILIRWTNLTNVLNRKVGHYVVFLNRRNNTVTLHQVVNGDQLTTEINGLTYSTNYSVEVVGVDTMGKPYKTPSEATMTANRKRETPLLLCFCFCLFVCLFVCFFFCEQVCTISKKSWNLPGNFPYPEKVWKIELKSWKKSWFFLKLQQVLHKWIFFVLFKSFSILPARYGKNFVPLFLPFFFLKSLLITYLITLSVEKKNILFWKKNWEKSWILDQKSAQTNK